MRACLLSNGTMWIKNMEKLFLSNVRFLQSHYLLNIFKIVSNVIGFFFFLTLWLIQSKPDVFLGSNILQYRNIFLLAIVLVTCASYMWLQSQTLNLRRKEIFIRRWYGAKKLSLFWIFFLEHVTVLFLSVIFSVVTFDFVRSFINNLTAIALQQGYVSFIVPVVINTLFILLSGALLVLLFIRKR